jgi:16S rRNA (guanine527-N7)-methyltransferase
LSGAGRAALRAQAADFGVPLDDTQATQLLRLLDELAEWNRAYNLTAIDTPAAMITHHLLDSLAAHADLQGDRIADLGTGAGFPGLPLALLNPERQFTLIDATAKKIRFVTHAARVLELANVQAVHARAEDLASGPPFDCILARAVAELPELIRLARPLCRPGTRLLAYKGQRPDAEIAALPGDWQLLAGRALRIPGLEAERCLLTLVAVGDPRAASPAA